MDKYVKQSHKTHQHARRRNNTADNVLENRLKQIDKDIRYGHLQHMRKKNRIERELSDLERKSSDLYLPHNPTGAKPGGETNHDLGTQHEVVFGLVSNNNDNPSVHPKTDHSDCECYKSKRRNENQDDLFLASSSSISERQVTKNQSSQDDEFQVWSSNKTSCSKTEGHISEMKTISGKLGVRTDTDDSCDNNHFNLRMPSVCNHFPCKHPKTYHTIGFRREDLCPYAFDLVQGSMDHSNEDFLTESEEGPLFLSGGVTESPKDFQKYRRNGHCVKNLEGSTISANSGHAINTKWIRNDKSNNNASSFRRTIHGPLFGYTPVDPVLERIRHRKVEPTLHASCPVARVSIRERIRGVQQLVKEMKLSNEKLKPRDWATNYGKRVPTRILLNPVVPV